MPDARSLAAEECDLSAVRLHPRFGISQGVKSDGSVKVRHEGLWVNETERAYAEDDDQFITPAMYQARQPTFTRSIPNCRAARRSAS